MNVSMNTDLRELSWQDFICLKLYAEIAPRGAVENRALLLRKIELERQRRIEEELIPEHPGECPF